MDSRTCPYCGNVIGKGLCCHRLRKNLTEPIPFARFFAREPAGSPPSRRARRRKVDPVESNRFDDVVRVIEDARDEA